MSTETLGPLTDVAMVDLRRRRNELQATETALSYVRRLVQGRLDIVLDERHHRDAGEGGRDVSALVADLPKILSEHVMGGGRGALPDVHIPAGEIDDVVRLVDHVVDAERLGALTELSDADLDGVAAGLTQLEQRVSHYRHELHASIDALQEEIVRRYKSGEASVDALLQ